MEEIKKLIAEIQKGNIQPVYFLMGDEPYYIDGFSEYIATTILTEEERGFNQMVLYGRDVSVMDIISNAKRYPMMADKQVIIVKEAQDLSRTIDDLATYVEQPQPTTVLVICYKYKTLDKRKKLYKALQKKGVLFESKKMYENQAGEWIRKRLASNGYTITPKAAQMLVEFLGIELSKIDNELQKLQLIIPTGSQITPEIIEENIGISKDFNNFELKKAVAERDVVRATRIITYFGQNPKDNPIVVTMGILFSFFQQLLQYHGLTDHSPKHVASSLKINPYFVGEIQTAARNYPMKRVSGIIASLREIDMKSKGVGAANLSQADLLKEMLIKVMA